MNPAQMPPRIVEALIRREKLAMVGRLLKGVVHNISGAVQMVRLPLDLLELKLASVTTSQVADKLTAAQQGLNRLTDEVSMLSAKAAIQAQPTPDPVDLCALLRDQLRFWRADPYFKHQVKLTLDLSDNLPFLRVDPSDLALAFNALVANAVEALNAAQRGQLSARAWRLDGELLVEVVDDGPGPSPTMAAGLFEPFNTDKGWPHDGLGLFLARQALAPWRGDVRWSAQRPNAFLLVLPLAKA
ncbi:histidine kinase [Desulfarculus baarsii DSM 2075]|uniref:Histidine kinase n=1 Tax=Desulfarculus baarsii (strain ATCC 33931 / DSM 2075 / LMG 7858 / VKM B-1802 / 2st14) TaxID=644282 RepID=E1QLB5_DESB2|nr:ATP-binding protein [Desulfarculus baarsii]ADK85380.1 histidine kinase [Desulfarculus baarsii DSM 2075]